MASGITLWKVRGKTKSDLFGEINRGPERRILDIRTQIKMELIEKA